MIDFIDCVENIVTNFKVLTVNLFSFAKKCVGVEQARTDDIPTPSSKIYSFCQYFQVMVHFNLEYICI